MSTNYKNVIRKTCHILGITQPKKNFDKIIFNSYPIIDALPDMLSNICTFGEYEGYKNRSFQKKLLDFILEYIFEKKIYSKEFKEKLYYYQSIEEIYNNFIFDEKISMSKIKYSNTPIAIVSGSQNHAVGLSFFKKFLIYTNTGEGSGNNEGTFILEISKEKMHRMPEVLQPLENGNNTVSKDMKDFHSRLKDLLNEEQITALSEKVDLEKNPPKTFVFIPSSKQKRQDCTQSNSKKNIKGILIILNLLYHNKEITIESIKELVNQHFIEKNSNGINLYHFYKNITKNNRLKTIEKVVENMKSNDFFFSYEGYDSHVKTMMEIALAFYIIQHKGKKYSDEIITEISKLKVTPHWNKILTIVWFEHLCRNKEKGNKSLSNLIKEANDYIQEIKNNSLDKSNFFYPYVEYILKISSKENFNAKDYLDTTKEMSKNKVSIIG